MVSVAAGAVVTAHGQVEPAPGNEPIRHAELVEHLEGGGLQALAPRAPG